MSNERESTTRASRCSCKLDIVPFSIDLGCPWHGPGTGATNGYDPINHPSHYTYGKYEAIEVIEDWGLGFALGNAVKYIARAGKKGNAIEDLKKAKWYIEREIQRLELCEPASR